MSCIPSFGRTSLYRAKNRFIRSGGCLGDLLGSAMLRQEASWSLVKIVDGFHTVSRASRELPGMPPHHFPVPFIPSPIRRLKVQSFVPERPYPTTSLHKGGACCMMPLIPRNPPVFAFSFFSAAALSCFFLPIFCAPPGRLAVSKEASRLTTTHGDREAHLYRTP